MHIYIEMCLMYIVYSECDINLCENGGLCKKLGVSYICECKGGFTGSLCQTGNQMHTLITSYKYKAVYTYT